ncbi:MAG: multidrug DMT transporter permease [Bryobacterales bacterium]|nr:multidrug DMT transporter permease [Bryobacterales bacterium]MDE0263390.1 multidrug DMT transporter permease [Bryobacterales bacterium]MDE0622695.1 multidrug DMT transporter permease [Bryobacterales bacterium]
MFVVESLGLAIFLCIITMMGWGSWANTQKLAGKEDWPFELYYWDYAIGVFLTGILFALTLGSFGNVGMGAAANLGQAAGVPIGDALLSGALFNVANILLVVAIDAAGMSLAFPVGVGLALVIGTVRSYIQAPKGDPTLLFAGVALIVIAMIMSALAYSKLPAVAGRRLGRGLLFAVVAGCLMGSFYPMLVRAVSPDFSSGAIEAGFLTPYTALFYFGIGLLLSNFVVNTIFMKAGGKTYGRYFGGGPKLHSLGILGGMIWMVALGLNVIASGVAGPAISYALGQGATLVAAIWGVFIWKEFKSAPASAYPFIVLMFLGYTNGLALIGVATL